MGVAIFCLLMFVVVSPTYTLRGDNICLKNETTERGVLETTEICCTGYEEKNAKCVECSPGFFGRNCTDMCPENYYGRKCLTECNCNETQICHHVCGCLQRLDLDYSNITNNGESISLEKLAFSPFAEKCPTTNDVLLVSTRTGLIVSRDTVYHLMNILYPVGILKRKRRRLHRRQYMSNGPDHVWHIDSYDKLKPYGIAINGCIDGFSRNIIWMEANSTNSDPKVIADYYIKAVERRRGCPQRVRADMGTENVYIEQMQKFLRRNHDDAQSGENSLLYGKSTHNQMIEWFWGILRKEVGQFWMNFFADMASCIGETIFCGTFLDKILVQFCFMDIIQKDLDNLVEIWNTHNISGGKGMHGGNRQIMLYTLPELYNKQRCICYANEAEVDACSEETTPKADFSCDETVRDLCLLIMDEDGYAFPKDCEDARKLHTHLRETILSSL